MSHNNPPVRNAVIAAIRAHGPMTCHEIAEALDWPLERVQGTLRSTRRLRPGEVFRVTGYKRAAEGKGKDASIYAAEAGPDAPRMAKTSLRIAANLKRYRKKHQALRNARLRLARALKADRPAQASPWQQLAPKGALSHITQIALHQQAQT